ncbi:MAG: hypothetical protein GF355_03390 [Candidatus Eisenbacteria bacterium]|nr:hypothetical protein [Candidatus Eisenbacteria bacterium]
MKQPCVSLHDPTKQPCVSWIDPLDHPRASWIRPGAPRPRPLPRPARPPIIPPMARAKRKKRTRKDTISGHVRAHNPFELIRWLALSQPDPRKALSELVQNSLDAGARHIRVIRVREKGVPCLKIRDDGEGVIPEMDRPEALRYIATHIGHSRKRSLSPQERMTLMTQGQYGIGLLGFWSLGQTLEMRSAVAGHKHHRLILHRDRPDFVIEPLRGRLPLEETWTEVVVAGLHREALSILIGRRAADYLASELRGQLLAREVDLVVEDRISRGRAQKLIPIKPQRFLGERIMGIETVAVEGYPPIRLEIYVTGESSGDEEHAGIAVYSAGTLVAEGFHGLSALGLDRTPWTDARLTGMVDFPGFRVAPGSRRGVVLDEAAGAFAAALSTVEPHLTAHLERLERERAEQLDRNMIRDLQRAFRDFYRQRPRYEMLPVQSKQDEEAGPAGKNGRGGKGEDPSEGETPPGAEETPGETPPGAAEQEAGPTELFPPGPLESVRVTPSKVRMPTGGKRRLRAEGLDRNGRVITEAIRFEWTVHGFIGSLQTAEHPSDQAELTAGSEPAGGSITVTADSEGRAAAIDVPVEVVDELAFGRSGEGIPEPEFVNQPGAAWRSRMHEERWQVNSGHRDFRSVADRPALKLRYLAMLFAKEIVLRSHHDPRLERPLEQMAEIVTYADQRLAAKGRPRKRH